MKHLFKTQYAEYITSGEWRKTKFDLTPYLPLDYMNLQDLDLTYLSFKGLILENVNFSNCNLNQVDFSNCHIKNCIFNEADMTYANLSNSTIEDSMFEGTQIEGSGFIRAKKVINNVFSKNDVEVSELKLSDKIIIALGKRIYVDREIDQTKQIELMKGIEW